jgi:hypothetical protein
MKRAVITASSMPVRMAFISCSIKARRQPKRLDRAGSTAYMMGNQRSRFNVGKDTK